MKRVIWRLSLYSFSLLLLVMLYSFLPIHYKGFYEGIYNSKVGFIFGFAFHNLINSFMPGVFAIGYTACVLPVLNDNARQQSILVVNAILLIVVSVAIGLVLFYTSILHYDDSARFTRTMTAVGLLNIVLSFMLKAKQLETINDR
ncbi:MAG TPA: hypothetical protein PKO32_04480 [Syntrophomonadaceae bacterium]|nr:hypothetical protein [Syntrophomonadaceae bacterium]HQA06969.1 hypothetical protein [Syntrophomonadaceae bacterium]